MLLLLQEVLAPVAVLKARMEHQSGAVQLDSEAASAKLGFKCRAVCAHICLFQQLALKNWRRTCHGKDTGEEPNDSCCAGS